MTGLLLIAAAWSAEPCTLRGDTVDGCRVACEAGQSEDCHRLGYLLETGLGVPQPARPVTDEEPELEWPFEDEMSWVGSEPERTRDLPGAIAAYTRACDLDHPTSCVSAGVLLELKGPHHAPKAARALFARAFSGWTAGCEAGNGNHCELMGAAWSGNWGHRADGGVARSWFERACTQGDGRGCWQLASSATDSAEAEVLLVKSCDVLDAVVGCLALRERYGPGGAAPDPARHRQYAERACTLDPTFCSGSGVRLPRE